MSTFTGTLPLVRVALRRDRMQLGIWLFALAGFTMMSANSFSGLYTTQQEVEETVAILSANPVMRAMGLASGADLGALVMMRALPIVVILAAVMSVTAVARQTRQNEDTRRAELIRSAVVGRHAQLGAALVLVAGTNALLAVLIAGALMLNGLDTAGSFVAGAAVGAAGFAFAGVAAVTAQVAERSRGATGLAIIVIGTAFLLSAVGNVTGTTSVDGFVVQSTWPAWLSPIGWAQQMRPFGGDHWSILGLFGTWSAGTIAVAFTLEARRDLGRGMLPDRRGPASAHPALLSPLGLAWRLHRGLLLGWSIGVATFGAVFGSVSRSLDDIIADNPQAAEFFARFGGTDELVEGYFAAMMALAATIITAYTITALLRLRAEESEGLLEPLLATAVSRTSWMLSHVVVVSLGTVLLLLLVGSSTGLLAGTATDNVLGQLRSLTPAALVHGPAALVVGAVAVVLFGFAPRYAVQGAWAAFALAIVAGPVVGEMLALPHPVLNLSPFTHVPSMPADSFEVRSAVWLMAASGTLGLVALVAFRRRDIVPQSLEERHRRLRFPRLFRRASAPAQPLAGS